MDNVMFYFPQGGDYIVTLMDHYGADFSVLILSCFEVISVMWVYGKGFLCSY